MRKLPRSPEELRGLRAARWIRESKAEQADNWGPDAQRAQQDRVIERHGLVDTGISWQVAHSGRTIASTSQWAEMMAAAGDRYDVLVVGYVSRFARDLRTAVNARHDLHAAGAALLFADDGVLSSDEDKWETWAREAVEAEAYSRRMGRRIREGYAARRRRFADPGGTPPFGFRRGGPDRTLEPDPERYNVVRSIFELAAARLTDREVAAQAGLSIHVIRTTLQSPLYAGRLPDGSPTRFPPLVDPELWQDVQDVRARRRTRDGRPAKRTPYALSMLRCRACGRRLIGDVGRYRHPDVCPAFAAAVHRPTRRVRGQHREILGASYPVGLYEGAVREVLGRVQVGAELMAEVLTDPPAPGPDRLAAARISRARDTALEAYRRGRDARALEATMLRLDADQAALEETSPAWDPIAARAYLQELPSLWDDAPGSRRGLAEALFDEIRVLGLRSIDIVPSAEALARGLADAFQARSGGYGRGGGSPTFTSRLIPGVVTRIRIIVPPFEPLRAVRSA